MSLGGAAGEAAPPFVPPWSDGEDAAPVVRPEPRAPGQEEQQTGREPGADAGIAPVEAGAARATRDGRCRRRHAVAEILDRLCDRRRCAAVDVRTRVVAARL